MSFIREKQFWLAEPIKRLRREEGEPENLQDILVHSLAAAPVLSNLVGPLALINAGIRPQKIFQGSHMMPNPMKFNQLFPVFRYYNPPSPAYRTGAKVGSALGSFLSPTLHNVTASSLLGQTRTLAKGGASGARVGAKLGGRIGGRLIPGVGWALLAYDVYDVAVNRRLWGFDLE